MGHRGDTRCQLSSKELVTWRPRKVRLASGLLQLLQLCSPWKGLAKPGLDAGDLGLERW